MRNSGGVVEIKYATLDGWDGVVVKVCWIHLRTNHVFGKPWPHPKLLCNGCSLNHGCSLDIPDRIHDR